MICLEATLELGSVSLWGPGHPHWAVTPESPVVILPPPSPPRLAGSP